MSIISVSSALGPVGTVGGFGFWFFPFFGKKSLTLVLVFAIWSVILGRPLFAPVFWYLGVSTSTSFALC